MVGGSVFSGVGRSWENANNASVPGVAGAVGVRGPGFTGIAGVAIVHAGVVSSIWVGISFLWAGIGGVLVGAGIRSCAGGVGADVGVPPGMAP